MVGAIVKMLGVIGNPTCGCGHDAWVLIAPEGLHLQCFRHDLPQAVAVVVDKPWLSAEDLARLMVAKFLQVDMDTIEPDHPMVRGTLPSVRDQLQVLASVPTGATVTINGSFLLYRHPDGGGTRSLTRLTATT